MTVDDQTQGRQPLVMVIECLSAGAISTEDTVTSRYASVYVTSGVAADEIYTIAHVRKPGAAFVRLAESLKIADAEALADALARALREHGVPVEIAGIYDD